MTEVKQNPVEQFLTKIREMIKEVIGDIDEDTIVDIAAVASFLLGAICIGIGAQFALAVFVIPGIAMLILAIARFAYNVS